jgi:hypothetical protein
MVNLPNSMFPRVQSFDWRNMALLYVNIMNSPINVKMEVINRNINYFHIECSKIFIYLLYSWQCMNSLIFWRFFSPKLSIKYLQLKGKIIMLKKSLLVLSLIIAYSMIVFSQITLKTPKGYSDKIKESALIKVLEKKSDIFESKNNKIDVYFTKNADEYIGFLLSKKSMSMRTVKFKVKGEKVEMLSDNYKLTSGEMSLYDSEIQTLNYAQQWNKAYFASAWDYNDPDFGCISLATANAASYAYQAGYPPRLVIPGSRSDFFGTYGLQNSEVYLWGLSGHGNTSGDYFFLDQGIWASEVGPWNPQGIFFLNSCSQYSVWSSYLTSVRTFVSCPGVTNWIGEIALLLDHWWYKILINNQPMGEILNFEMESHGLQGNYALSGDGGQIEPTLPATDPPAEKGKVIKEETETSIANYPNPFNPTTNITYNIKETTPVKISIFNSIGQEVKYFDLGIKPKGSYKLEWNASGMPSGIYFYSIKTNNFSDIKKMILAK